MNQEKMGKFICELRKEQSMTQQQLADMLSVSSKTVSKWECGNGMPELSSILPLCDALHINVNELLSGERLPTEHYSEKAEENMMSLLQDSNTYKKQRRSFLPGILLIVVVSFLGIWYLLGSSLGFNPNSYILDSISMTTMVAVTVLFLIISGLWRPFCSSFTYLISKKKVPTAEELLLANTALKLAGNTWLVMGCLATCAGLIGIYISPSGNASHDTYGLSLCFRIAMQGLLYGLTGYLLLLPFRYKLKTITHLP